MEGGGDTIAAIATAHGRGGIAVVRVSGPAAFAVARSLTGRDPVPGRIAFADFGGLDAGVLLAFAAPRSYTGEDVVEFQCHGGRVTPRRILEACFAAGARLARRGEFTERAFLNGRLSLDAAAGVIDLVDAKTERAADAALARLGGEASRRHRGLYDEALELSADLEHALDIDEGELPPEFAADIAQRLERLRGGIARSLAKLHEGRLLREGATVVLAGAPNAGKSSLMNALLGESRAIVSDTPGTTRDSIEECLDLGGWPVRLVDTAGLREAADAVEREGVERALRLIAGADVLVALDCELPGALHLHAKCDLGRGEGLNVSAVTGEGLAELRAAIVTRLEALAAEADEIPADADRESSLLHQALSTLPPTSQTSHAVPLDLVLAANAVRNCAERLGELAGATYSEDLLDSVFSRFCVGK